MEKESLEKNWFKGGIIVALFLAVFFTNNYFQEQNRLAGERAAREDERLSREQEQKDREFDATQKESCLAIYKQESSKWGNVNGWRYDDEKDTCYVEYKSNPPKTKEECDAAYMWNGEVMPLFLTDWGLCLEGLFEKAF